MKKLDQERSLDKRNAQKKKKNAERGLFDDAYKHIVYSLEHLHFVFQIRPAGQDWEKIFRQMGKLRN